MSTTERPASVNVNVSTGEMRVTLPGLLAVGEDCTVVVHAAGVDVSTGGCNVGDHEDQAVATRYALQAIREEMVAGALRAAAVAS